MTDKKKTILEAVEKLTDTYRKEELFLGKDRERLPNTVLSPLPIVTALIFALNFCGF